MNITKEDVQWLLVQMRHNEFSHDFIKDEKRCIKCKRIKAIRARLEAVAPMLVSDAIMTKLCALRDDWREDAAKETRRGRHNEAMDSNAHADELNTIIESAPAPPNTTRPNVATEGK